MATAEPGKGPYGEICLSTWIVAANSSLHMAGVRLGRRACRGNAARKQQETCGVRENVQNGVRFGPSTRLSRPSDKRGAELSLQPWLRTADAYLGTISSTIFYCYQFVRLSGLLLYLSHSSWHDIE